MMNQASPGFNPDALAIVPAKRKRGRPRKYPSADDAKFHLGEGSPMSRTPNTYGGGNIHFPPGFKGVNGNQARQVDPIDSVKGGMAGQMVSGVIEAEFDGGYLLTVKIRNSDITLRGVVFKPGRFSPVTAENDVAPHIQMIQRDEVPLPSESYGRLSNSRSRERNGASHPLSSPSTNLVALKSKLTSPPSSAQPVQSVMPLRGNVVPVVLQPVASTNGGFPNQRGSPGNQESHFSKESQPVALQVVHPQAESTETGRKVCKVDYEVTPEPMRLENGPQDQSQKGASSETEVKTVRPPGIPLENLVTEAMKRIHTPSEAEDTEDSKPPGKSSIILEDGVGNPEHHQPMFIEPFQSVQHYPINRSSAITNPLDSERTGKMTELLQAVQENAMKNQMPEAQ